MLFKSKTKSFLFLTLLLSNASVFAENPALHIPTGTSAAMSNAGSAASGDQSVVDINPAILPALKKQYTLFGNVAFKSRLNLAEIGVFDSQTSALSAVVKARETIPDSDTTRDRRITVGLAYQVPDTKFSFGLSGDYELIDMPTNTKFTTVNSFFGGGLLYQWNALASYPLFLGLSVTNAFNRVSTSPAVFDAGLSTVFFDGFYTLSVDALINHTSGIQSFVSGLDIVANQFLDLRGSIGYNPKGKNVFWGAGVFFNAPVLHLYYTVSLLDPNVTNNDATSKDVATQTVGLALAF